MSRDRPFDCPAHPANHLANFGYTPWIRKVENTTCIWHSDDDHPTGLFSLPCCSNRECTSLGVVDFRSCLWLGVSSLWVATAATAATARLLRQRATKWPVCRRTLPALKAFTGKPLHLGTRNCVKQDPTSPRAAEQPKSTGYSCLACVWIGVDTVVLTPFGA